MLTVPLHWAVECQGHRKVSSWVPRQKLCGQRGSQRNPCAAKIQRKWGPGGDLSAQKGHGKDRWDWAMELWAEAYRQKDHGAKSKRGISRGWNMALWVPEGQTNLESWGRG